MRYKSNEEILELIEIDEVFTESSWSEIEDIQSEIITALSDKFDIIKEESDGNCMLGALSRGWFGAPLCHNKIRESICDYIINRVLAPAFHFQEIQGWFLDSPSSITQSLASPQETHH